MATKILLTIGGLLISKRWDIKQQLAYRNRKKKSFLEAEFSENIAMDMANKALENKTSQGGETHDEVVARLTERKDPLEGVDLSVFIF